MKTNEQFEDFLNSFLEFESQNNLFNVKINGVRVWHRLRWEVFSDLQLIKGFMDENAQGKIRAKQSNKSLEFIWKKYVSCNELFAHRRDVLIVSHGRKYKDEGKYYKCPYTHLLDEYLSNSHYILDRVAMGGTYELQRSHNILYSDPLAFKKIMHLYFPQETVKRSDVEAKVVEPLQSFFGINISMKIKQKWTVDVNKYLNERKECIAYYSYLLGKICPKIILIAYAYGTDGMTLCEVAHKKHIPIIELQHGIMGDVAYNFKSKMRLKTFPDYIFTFGELEKKLTRFPIPESHIIPVGYPELENAYNHYKIYKTNKSDKKIILFISALSIDIAKFANAVAGMLDKDKYQVVIQLHPFEYTCWKETIGKYLTHPAIKVVGSFEHLVYESLAQADWVVGNYSTVLSEAQMFDVKVAVLKFKMYQSVKFLYQNGYALLVDTPERLVKEIEEDTFQPNRDVKLFEKNSLQNMQTNIDKIIEKCQ